MDLQINRFIAAQSIMLSIIGVPGIYFHSLFGSRGWLEGVKQTGRNRTINREKCQFNELQNQLANETTLRYKVFTRYTTLLKVRSGTSAFHPHGKQNILDLHSSVFAVERISPDEQSRVLCLHNASGQTLSFSTPYESATDLFVDQRVNISTVSLKPYQVLWLKIN